MPLIAKRDDTDMAIGLIVGLIIVPLVLGVLMAIMVPLFGAMVRYRAHYRPLGVHLGHDKQGVGETRERDLDRSLPQPTSLFGTLRRVKALEGWYGLYKGLYPMLGTLLAIMPIMAVAAAVEANHANGPLKTTSLGSAITIGILLIAVLPLQVLSTRSLTSLKKTLLTPAERANPLRLFTIPGLLPVVLFTSLLATIVSWAGRHFIIGTRTSDLGGRYLLLLLFRTVMALCMIPLDVVSIRLSVMPGAHAIESGAAEEAGLLADEVPLIPCSSGEAVIRVRAEGYEGALHCVKAVAQEEGKGALFRGWIWTLLGGSFSSLG